MSLSLPSSSAEALEPPPVGGRAASLGDATELDALERLQNEHVNLVSWRRALPTGLGEHLDAWTRLRPATLDQVVSSSSYDLSRVTIGLPDAARGWLIADIAWLLDRFGEVAGARRLRVAFGVGRTDECRKFHVDYVRYRLVTTYLGPGTEWVPEQAVCRSALRHPEDCQCNEDIVRDAAAVRHAVPGEVLLMKGALHPSGLGGAVHRSPPIEGTGRARVVLALSTVESS